VVPRQVEFRVTGSRKEHFVRIRDRDLASGHRKDFAFERLRHRSGVHATSGLVQRREQAYGEPDDPPSFRRAAMGPMVRRSLVAGPLFAAILVAGCSSATTTEAGAVATSGSGPADIGIETSSLFVTVVNNAGAPIQDVQVAIQAVGSPLQ